MKCLRVCFVLAVACLVFVDQASGIAGPTKKDWQADAKGEMHLKAGSGWGQRKQQQQQQGTHAAKVFGSATVFGKRARSGAGSGANADGTGQAHQRKGGAGHSDGVESMFNKMMIKRRSAFLALELVEIRCPHEFNKALAEESRGAHLKAISHEDYELLEGHNKEEYVENHQDDGANHGHGHHGHGKGHGQQGHGHGQGQGHGHGQGQGHGHGQGQGHGRHLMAGDGSAGHISALHINRIKDPDERLNIAGGFKNFRDHSWAMALEKVHKYCIKSDQDRGPIALAGIIAEMKKASAGYYPTDM